MLGKVEQATPTLLLHMATMASLVASLGVSVGSAFGGVVGLILLQRPSRRTRDRHSFRVTRLQNQNPLLVLWILQLTQLASL